MTAAAKLAWPGRALRWMLRLSALAGAALLVGALWIRLLPPPAEPSDLPDVAAGFAEFTAIVAGVWTAYALLGLLALRRPRPLVGTLFLVVAVVLPTAALIARLTDAAEEASAAEMNWLVVALPLWCGAIALLASAATTLRAMGLRARPWAWAVRGLVVAALAGYGGWIAWCGSRGRSAAPAALAQLEAGMTWGQVVASAGKLCPMSRGEVMAGVMWLRCAPAAPPVCRCAPALNASIELRFEDQKLVSWRRRLQLAGFAPQ